MAPAQVPGTPQFGKLSSFHVSSQSNKPIPFPKHKLTNGLGDSSQTSVNGDSALKEKSKKKSKSEKREKKDKSEKREKKDKSEESEKKKDRSEKREKKDKGERSEKKHKDKKEKRHKDKSEKRSSKKRSRDEEEEETEAEAEAGVVARTSRSTSPTKRRKSEALPHRSHQVSQDNEASSAATISQLHPPSTNTDQSHFRREIVSLCVPLAPVIMEYGLKGICALNLSPLLLTYFEPVKGMIISYDNVRISQDPDLPDSLEPSFAKLSDIYGTSFVWVTADFVVFTPQIGQPIEGYVNIQTESHIGLVCLNLFSASIERTRLPPDWKWVDTVGDEVASTEDAQKGEGHFVDSEGNDVEGVLEFRISGMELPMFSREEKTFLTMSGTLLSEEDEKKVKQEEIETQKKAREKLIHGVKGH